jgi:hypothetical protein
MCAENPELGAAHDTVKQPETPSRTAVFHVKHGDPIRPLFHVKHRRNTLLSDAEAGEDFAQEVIGGMGSEDRA